MLDEVRLTQDQVKLIAFHEGALFDALRDKNKIKKKTDKKYAEREYRLKKINTQKFAKYILDMYEIEANNGVKYILYSDCYCPKPYTDKEQYEIKYYLVKMSDYDINNKQTYFHGKEFIKSHTLLKGYSLEDKDSVYYNKDLSFFVENIIYNIHKDQCDIATILKHLLQELKNKASYNDRFKFYKLGQVLCIEVVNIANEYNELFIISPRMAECRKTTGKFNFVLDIYYHNMFPNNYDLSNSQTVPAEYYDAILIYTTPELSSVTDSNIMDMIGWVSFSTTKAAKVYTPEEKDSILKDGVKYFRHNEFKNLLPYYYFNFLRLDSLNKDVVVSTESSYDYRNNKKIKFIFEYNGNKIALNISTDISLPHSKAINGISNFKVWLTDSEHLLSVNIHIDGPIYYFNSNDATETLNNNKEKILYDIIRLLNL